MSNIIWRHRRRRRTSTVKVSVYHQLVLGICTFDSMSSIMYMLVGVMAPHSSGFYLSRGNETTCSIQGFFTKLGYTSIFYNLCLSFYFLLVICYNCREEQIQKHLWKAHASVITVGTTLAFGSIPFFGPLYGTCYVSISSGLCCINTIF